MDRFDAMKVLIEAIDRGSLSAAGRALRMPLATVSRKLTELEAHLGAKLLLRGTRSLALTDAGAAFAAKARIIIEDLRAAELEATGEMMAPKGELVVTAPVAFGKIHVLPIVAEFLQNFPLIDVRLALGDRNLQFVDDQVDMAVRIGALRDSAAIVTKVGEMRTVVCASPGFLDRHGRPTRPADMANLPCVLNDTPMNAAGWSFTTPASRSQQVVRCRPRISVNGAEAAVEAARLHMGLVRSFHYQVASAIEEGSLEVILQEFEPAPAPVHLMHVSRGQMPLKMRCFIDFAAPRLRQRLLPE